MNPLVWIVLIGTGAVFAIKAKQATETGAVSSIKLLNVDSIKLIATEIELSASIAIDNPTRNTISVKKPYLKLYTNGQETGNSVPTDEMIPIKANARTVINKVNIRVSLMNLPAVANAILRHKFSEQTITVEVLSEVNGIKLRDKKDYKLSELLSA